MQLSLKVLKHISCYYTHKKILPIESAGLRKAHSKDQPHSNRPTDRQTDIHGWKAAQPPRLLPQALCTDPIFSHLSLTAHSVETVPNHTLPQLATFVFSHHTRHPVQAHSALWVICSPSHCLRLREKRAPKTLARGKQGLAAWVPCPWWPSLPSVKLFPHRT